MSRVRPDIACRRCSKPADYDGMISVLTNDHVCEACWREELVTASLAAMNAPPVKVLNGLDRRGLLRVYKTVTQTI